MSTAEKIAAEWEARHDVAARGHRPDPLVVQHYLAHARTEEARHHVPPPAPAAPAGPPPAGESPVAGRPETPVRWWRRVLGRR
ncbi:hypothetical protein DQ240_21240 [Blastococcus sp. TF02A-26]|nr:hypothetical protein DQ240_21240 [Blastococcus sp. TF02A-26]